VNNCSTKNQTACNAEAACNWRNNRCRFDDGCNNADQATCSSRPQCGWTPPVTSTSVQQFAFNTPYGAPEDAICGRVAYSGFHVVGSSGANYKDQVFPNHCAGNLTAQEKVLLYMLFDLGACVSTDVPEAPTCTPRTIDDCSNRCGVIPDGCGGNIDCNTCPQGQTCMLPAHVCQIPSCTKTTCAAEGATCSLVADGCGGVLDCGDCGAGQQCGIVAANQCTPVCTPAAEVTACATSCGFVSDGCGGVYECADCSGSLSCVAQACVSQACTPLTQCPVGKCGTISDGCSGQITCASCTAPETCGGGGVANECGAPQCSPLTCQSTATECGWIGDGCGGAADCGGCPPGQVCGAGGPNKCGGCEPQGCGAAECGAVGDGCGGINQCGTCTNGQICGLNTPNQCDTPTSGQQCSKLSCTALDADCGVIGDGCGGTVQCGACPNGQVCGLNTPFKCATPPACVPSRACQSQDCGAIGDGCGGLLDCGGCPSGQACGINNSPNRCSAILMQN
jgi:hypothetical protein